MEPRNTAYGLRVRRSVGYNNGILLGSFFETTMKNCYGLTAFARAAKGGALAQRGFLSFAA